MRRNYFNHNFESVTILNRNHLKKLLILSCFSVLLIGLATVLYAQQTYLILIAKVYKGQNCNGATFASAEGYEVEYKVGAANYKEMLETVKGRAARNNNVSMNDVNVESARRQFACVITYSKEHSGWRCSTKQYAIGFGDTQDDAENNAVASMVRNYKRVSYQVLQHINAANW